MLQRYKMIHKIQINKIYNDAKSESLGNIQLKINHMKPSMPQ
jgi:hypothetical protein